MSDFVFHGFEDSLKKLFGKKDTDATKKKGYAKTVKIFFLVFVAIFAIEAIIYLIILPSMQTPTIVWSGSKRMSTTELTKVISPLVTKSWMKFDESEAMFLLSDVSSIEDVQVVKRFPDKVYINVIEREPVAMTFVSDGKNTVPIQIDKNGVLFSIHSNQSYNEGSLVEQVNRSIPLLSGIPIENISGKLRIPQKYRGLLAQIDSIKNRPQNYFAAISEIRIVPKEYGNYELVLFPNRSKVRVLTGRQLTEDDLQYMMVALDVVNKIEPNVTEIDIRYGSASYRTRQSSGDSF